MGPNILLSALIDYEYYQISRLVLFYLLCYIHVWNYPGIIPVIFNEGNENVKYT